MYLLQLQDDGKLSLVEPSTKEMPPYAILSHTWGRKEEEVTFQDIMNRTGRLKAGYRKILFCGEQAKRDGLSYFWVDTCCINKESSQDLSEAINSMFRWYKNAMRCYVYLSDVSVHTWNVDDKSSIRNSRWFTRGWTLQELIAPERVEFFSLEEQRLGDKFSLKQTIYEITGISIEALRGNDLYSFTVEERLSWAKNRETKCEEDSAYSLLGLFDIHIPLIYGEGRINALRRLKRAIIEARLEQSSLTMSTLMNSTNHITDFSVLPSTLMMMPHDPRELSGASDRFGPSFMELTLFQDNHLLELRPKYGQMLSQGTYIRKQMGSSVNQYGWLARTFEILISIVTSETKQKDTTTISARWPLRLPLGLHLDSTTFLQDG
jgi:hypothetical protein